MLKTKYTNKFYIKQFILNDNHTFQDEIKNIKEVSEKNAIISYIFYKQDNKFGIVNYILNLYLINRDYYSGEEISIDELTKAWNVFLITLTEEPNKRKQVVFKNPPIKEWMDSKDNWCKKIATKYAAQFKAPYEDMLSNVYMSIMKAYHKGYVYMGNLNYLSLCIFNDIKMDLRYNRNRLNLSNEKVVSLDTIIIEDEGHSLTIGDIIPDKSADMSEDNIEYQDFKKQAVSLLSKSFSDREIDLILNSSKSMFLPRGLYERLRLWRKKHNIKELYE